MRKRFVPNLQKKTKKNKTNLNYLFHNTNKPGKNSRIFYN